MSRAVQPLVVIAGWLLPLACAVYDPSLLEGRRAADGGDSDAGRGGSASGSGASSGKAAVNPGGGGSSTAGTTSSNTSGSGGTAGSDAVVGGSDQGGGGAPDGEAGAPPVPSGGSGPGLVFDTMGDGNYVFFLTSEARGRWYLSHDATAGEQTPLAELIAEIPDGRDGSTRAVHVVSSGYSSWGASVGFMFETNVGNDRVSYDASAYSGISFFARVEAGSATSVRVNLPDMNTDPLGEVCLTADAGTDDCLDHFGTNLQLTGDFTHYTLSFAQLGQVGWGKIEPSLDASKLLGMEVSWAANASMDLWIDDVTLVP